MKAILEMDAPESCKVCPWVGDFFSTERCVGRHPACPLKIVEDNKEVELSAEYLVCEKCGKKTLHRFGGLCPQCYKQGGNQ
ncbi:MAG: hypothetical protein LBH43_15585 [Treponema sp.]|nr:hypothetical protein [Treponema sp.]